MLISYVKYARLSRIENRSTEEWQGWNCQAGHLEEILVVVKEDVKFAEWDSQRGRKKRKEFLG